MKRSQLAAVFGLIGGVIFVLVLVALLVVNQSENFMAPQVAQNPPTPSTTPIETAAPTTTSATPSPPVEPVTIALILLEDGGTQGTEVGCGDSVVLYTLPMTESTQDTFNNPTAALQSLLTYKPESNQYYSALSDSTVTLQNLEVSAGTARVFLAGDLRLAGVCNNPRVTAQLEKTLLQFPNITTVTIYLNNTPLSEVLSEQ